MYSKRAACYAECGRLEWDSASGTTRWLENENEWDSTWCVGQVGTSQNDLDGRRLVGRVACFSDWEERGLEKDIWRAETEHLMGFGLTLRVGVTVRSERTTDVD